MAKAFWLVKILVAIDAELKSPANEAWGEEFKWVDEVVKM